jgi:hypothetical protein
MPFSKGQSGNAKGKPKGARNRTTEEVRQTLLQLLDDNLDKLQADIDSLGGKERANLLINLAKHCTPPALQMDRLTESQMLQIIKYLKENENNS